MESIDDFKFNKRDLNFLIKLKAYKQKSLLKENLYCIFAYSVCSPNHL